MNYVNGEANAARNALEGQFEELMEAHPEGAIVIPSSGFSSLILYAEDEGGLLKGF